MPQAAGPDLNGDPGGEMRSHQMHEALLTATPTLRYYQPSPGNDPNSRQWRAYQALNIPASELLVLSIGSASRSDRLVGQRNTFGRHMHIVQVRLKAKICAVVFVCVLGMSGWVGFFWKGGWRQR